MTPRLTAALAVCGVATVGLGAAPDYSLREESVISRTLRFAAGSTGGGRALDIRNVNGSIRVTGTGGDAVELRARRTIAADTSADLQRAERESVLDITSEATTIAAIVREPGVPTCGEDWDGAWRRRARYEVTYDITVAVPPGTSLRLCTINGRAIEVTGTRGDFEIDNVNGLVSLRDVRGSGSARTVNGGVSADLLDVPPPGRRVHDRQRRCRRLVARRTAGAVENEDHQRRPVHRLHGDADGHHSSGERRAA